MQDFGHGSTTAVSSRDLRDVLKHVPLPPKPPLAWLINSHAHVTLAGKWRKGAISPTGVLQGAAAFSQTSLVLTSICSPYRLEPATGSLPGSCFHCCC